MLLDAKRTDPELLRDNSQIKSFTTSRFTYPGIRVFYKQPSEADKLPTDPAPLPLLVFIHGLGGSVAQFHPLLLSLTKISSCLAIDAPGCGVSEFAPTSWDAYTTDALAELLEIIIDGYRDKNAGQGVVLIGHSMGCALSTRLASKSSPHSTDLAEHVVGLIAVCPPAGPPEQNVSSMYRKLLWIPGTIFDIWRAWDRRSGIESASVKRFVGPDAHIDSKRLQYRFNFQSKTPTWRRMALGCLPVYENGVAKGGIPGKETWASLDIPVYLIGGEADLVTPPKEINKIREVLQAGDDASSQDSPNNSQPIVDAAAPVDTGIENRKPATAETIERIRDEDFDRPTKVPGNGDSPEEPSTPQAPPTDIPPQPAHPKKVVQTNIIPHGTHGMMYMANYSHVLACKISDFLAKYITSRLDRSWQLRYLSVDGKWDVKNLAKWKSVTPVSDPIAGIFRAMKTMREVDEDHAPAIFVERWGNVVKDVIDISHDDPVYNPHGLERADVKYHKFPTVSKIPPTDSEVDGFIELVDGLRAEQKVRAVEKLWDESDEHFIGVHCHYGFNRTGYFLVCYLVERCGYETQQAIDCFAKARPNGIRHTHFKDQLFVKYADMNE